MFKNIPLLQERLGEVIKKCPKKVICTNRAKFE